MHDTSVRVMEQPNRAIYWSVRRAILRRLRSWPNHFHRCLILTASFLAKSFPTSIAVGTNPGGPIFTRPETDKFRSPYSCYCFPVLHYRCRIDWLPSLVSVFLQPQPDFARRCELATRRNSCTPVGGGYIRWMAEPYQFHP